MGQETKEFQTLCSLYFSVVKNKLYLHLGGGGVWRALCEGGAGGHLSTAPLPSPAPPDLGKTGNGPFLWAGLTPAAELFAECLVFVTL